MPANACCLPAGDTWVVLCLFCGTDTICRTYIDFMPGTPFWNSFLPGVLQDFCLVSTCSRSGSYHRFPGIPIYMGFLCSLAAGLHRFCRFLPAGLWMPACLPAAWNKPAWVTCLGSCLPGPGCLPGSAACIPAWSGGLPPPGSIPFGLQTTWGLPFCHLGSRYRFLPLFCTCPGISWAGFVSVLLEGRLVYLPGT